MTHQPAISYSTSFHSLFNRAGGRTSNVMPEKEKEELIEAFRKKIVRRAIEMQIGGFRPPDDPRTSWFGRVTRERKERIGRSTKEKRCSHCARSI